MAKRKKTTEEFIKKAIDKHGNRYDYSKSIYVKSNLKVEIICKQHGLFLQTPANHYKYGCMECGKDRTKESRKFTILDFIEKSKYTHGDKYNYENVEYINNNTKVCIICREHGEFWQTPASHWNGCGCPMCVFRFRNTDEYVTYAKLIHGDRFDYSKVEYTTRDDYIKIICPIHGEFKQGAQSHLITDGCQACSNKKKKTNDDFVRESGKIHNYKYDYSKSKYINFNTKLTITCPIHGDFEQYPTNHLRGRGCDKCARMNATLYSETILNRNKEKWCCVDATLYIIKCYNKDELFYKIGITKKEIHQRFKTNAHMPYNYEILYSKKSNLYDSVKLEIYLHKIHDDFKYIPKITFGGYTECFYKINKIESIIENCE